MANEEHLTYLLQGVEKWNAWRDRRTDIQPDLQGIRLHGMNLAGVNLGGTQLSSAIIKSVNLVGANLQGVCAAGIELNHVNLSYALLIEANLRYSDFTDVDFTGATLTNAWLMDSNFTNVTLRDANLMGVDLTLATFPGADFSGANLSNALLDGTNLSNTKLYRTNFTRTLLAKANFTNASMAWTVFADVDLRNVDGLETIQHYGPSSVGIDTLYRSKGIVPTLFLQSVGIPDSYLEFIRSTMQNNQQRVSCILVYSAEDSSFAERLYHDLQKQGLSCWTIPDDWIANSEKKRHPDSSIQFYDKLLLILSEHSISSEWVEQEIHKAYLKEGYEGDEHPKVFFPISLDQALTISTTNWAKHLRETRCVAHFELWEDSDEYQKALSQLLRDLKDNE